MSASVTGGELIDRDTAIVRDLDNTAVRLLDPTTFTFGGTTEQKTKIGQIESQIVTKTYLKYQFQRYHFLVFQLN